MPVTADALTGDVIVSSHFMVDMAGHVEGYFTEVSGLDVEVEVVEHKVMAANNQTIIRKMPGRSTAGEITLKRAVTTNRDIWDWRKTVEEGGVATARTNGTISLLSQEGDPVASWDLVAAWPSKVNATTLDSGSTDVLMEEMTIVFESMNRTL